MNLDQTFSFFMARTVNDGVPLIISLFGAQDGSDLVQNGYEEVGANPTEAQRLAFK
jgi:hypothetical protein